MTNVIAVALIILMAVVAFYLWRFMTRRAMRTVVTIFREVEASSVKKAKTLEELGLQRPSYLQRAFRRRDYKYAAADLLFRQGIIKATDSGKFYLDEDALDRSSLKRFISPS